MNIRLTPFAIALMVGTVIPALAQPANLPPPGGETPIAFDVHEGTSMAVSVSPNGKWLAVDLQGSLWIIPVKGGKARRITDYFNDARQPVWSPDGSRLVYFAYRDGGYDLWSIKPDGSDMHKLTEGPFDDREPVFSPDGKTLAFSSDRSGNYDIWTLDIATGAMKQVSSHAREDRLPTWSPDGARIAYSGGQGMASAIYVVDLSTGQESLLKQADGRAEAPSFGPSGQLAYVVQDDTGSHLAIDGKIVSGKENVFPFRISWDQAGGYFYVSDGKIRRGGAKAASTIDFAATLEVVKPSYKRAKRDWDSTAPRKALGIVHPRISPDGSRIAFVALGDLYVVSSKGGVPENLTKDAALDADPAWSPDGQSVVFSSDRVGGLPQLWIKDLKTGTDRQLTKLDTQPLGAAWSPDGTRVAFIDVDGRWGVAGVCVVDVATGKVTRLQTSLGQPGSPSWSSDGKYVAISLSYKFSNSFREGTNQVYVIPADGKGEPFWQIPEANMSLDTRSGSGPAWSPDGTKMAGIYEGLLKVWPVDKAGKPVGPVRSQTNDTAFYPTWTADSNTVLYQSNDALKTIDLATGVTSDVPVDLKYRLAKPTGRTVVHVSHLIDSVTDATQHDKDIIIDGNRIAQIRDHDPALHEGGAFVDGTGLTAMPGLIEYHSHVQKDFGSNLEKAWLAYGITTVRDPGTQVYDAVEDREAAEAGVRPSPRLYVGGPLLEWQRVYYKMGVAVSGPAHLERELERARLLKYDIVKSYVRMPDLYQRRIVEAAHDMGIPVSGHEIYPAAYSGVDGTEHMGATSRRGYSPKQGPGGMAYDDVIQLFGRSGRTLTPTNFGALTGYLEKNPDYRTDPRVNLYPSWARESVTGDNDPMARMVRPLLAGGLISLKKIYDAGAQVVAGTDTMIATNLHAEIASYVDAGLTPFQALQTATVNAAKALNLDAGTLEAGKLADIALVDGDPRANIANSFKVRSVIANGVVHHVDDLVKPNP